MLTPERHKLIGDLCYTALEMERPQRAAFLDQACAGDEDLRREVERMLAQETRAGSFLEAPVLEVAAKALAQNLNEAPSQRSVGRYQILSLIGAGGMGEVYRARDPQLRRDVAIKMLPAALAEERERLRRFRQESLVVSALNHPNIITIHELGEANGQHFMVMEYVAGQTLRQRLAERLPLAESLEIAAQVASALQAAHAAEVIHRDIKPENVMVRPDGLVKVLDFGLAKLTERGAAGANDETNMISLVKTEVGVMMGTVSYMSPEQARGQMMDARTDVFSLGVMIYEMVAGRRPFEGETKIEVLASILNLEPAPLSKYSREAPTELERIVNKALRKDRDERYQSISEMLLDLRSLKQRLEFEAGHGCAINQEPTILDSKRKVFEETRKSSAVPALVALTAILAIVAVGIATWSLLNSKSSVSISHPARERVLSYSLTVQRNRDGEAFGKPFESTGEEKFENSSDFQFNLSSPQPGFLYILNEGSTERGAPGYNLLFPDPKINSGQAYLTANQRIQTVPYVFGEHQGMDRVWIVWAEQPVEELEAVKDVVNPKDIGVIGDPVQVKRMREFLAKHAASIPRVEKDLVKKQVIVRGNGQMLVSLLELEHQ